MRLRISSHPFQASRGSQSGSFISNSEDEIFFVVQNIGDILRLLGVISGLYKAAEFSAAFEVLQSGLLARDAARKPAPNSVFSSYPAILFSVINLKQFLQNSRDGFI
ncbi:hypothetical protein [Aristophania vespae]|uniref:hypothetical protein n=1 Tax=Aristophania vespae TaxID=2697033 RepID=UPI001F4348B2|nr:hypothetical protein [Aristophania vespae]